MEKVLNLLSSFDSMNIPVVYLVLGGLGVLSGFGVLWGTWKATKLAINLTKSAISALAMVSFKAVSVGALFVLGMGGTGYSIGELASGPPSPETNKVLTNSDLRSLANSGNTDQGKLNVVLDYAKERDKLITKEKDERLVSLKNTYHDANPIEKPGYINNDYRIPVGILGTSLGLIICAAFWKFKEE